METIICSKTGNGLPYYISEVNEGMSWMVQAIGYGLGRNSFTTVSLLLAHYSSPLWCVWGVCVGGEGG